MDKKLVYVALVSGVLGTAIGAQVPGMTATAAISKAHTQVFQGDAAPALQTTIETGLAAQACTHANNQMGLTGDDAISHTAPDQCPIKRLNLKCSVVDGARVWQWEYATKAIGGTWSVGEPQ